MEQLIEIFNINAILENNVLSDLIEEGLAEIKFDKWNPKSGPSFTHTQ